MFLLVPLPKSKFSLVSHSYSSSSTRVVLVRSCNTRVALVSPRVARVLLVSLLSHSYRIRVARVALVSLVSGIRVVN